jgi:uncharacterized protein (DUF2141 family)
MVLAAATSTAALAQPENTISAPIQGLRSSKGVVRCGLFNSEAGFPKAGRQVMAVNGTIANQRATCVFTTIPPGTYAIAAFHAENNEMQVQTNMLGMPRQGFGFTRNPSAGLGAPAFKDAATAYSGGPVSWPIALKY